jgi:hypothetical protein
MKALIHRNQIKTVAVLALVVCAMTAVWSANSSARTDPPYPGGTGSYKPATQAPQLAPPVVRVEAPNAAAGNSETLPIVLSSVALLVALGGAGFVVLAGGRMRHAPQPGA